MVSEVSSEPQDLKDVSWSSRVPGRLALQDSYLTEETNTMTDDSIALKSLLEKASDADFLRGMIQFTHSGSWIWRWRPCAAPDTASAARRAPTSATAIASWSGRRAPGPFRYRSRSCARATTSWLFGAAPHRREGAGRGHPRGLRSRNLDLLRERPGQGHGHERRLQERGVAVVRRDRRARPRLPRSSDGGRLALRLARRHHHQNAPRRAHRLRRRHNRSGRERRAPTTTR